MTKQYYNLKEAVKLFHSNDTSNPLFYYFRKHTVSYRLYYEHTHVMFKEFFEYRKDGYILTFNVPHTKNGHRYKIPKLIFDRVMKEKQLFDSQKNFGEFYITEIRKILSTRWYKDTSNIIVSYLLSYSSLKADFALI